MRIACKLIVTAAIAWAGLHGLPAYAQAVDVAVALAADVSRSIDDDEFELQRRGYAAAITSEQFLSAVAVLPHHAVALCFIEWAGIGEQSVIVPWTMIRDRDSAQTFANALVAASRASFGRTAIGEAVDFAVVQHERATFSAVRRVIDVSGDGTSNSGRTVTAARDDAVAKGITVNGLAIINEKTGGEAGTFLYAHTHPPGGLKRYYADNVIGGPGSFALQIVNFDAFAEAMIDKLVTEISSRQPRPAQRATLPGSTRVR